MKRSKTIRLVLIGSLSAGALGGCDQPAAVSTDTVYTNNYYLPGAGYYHAPFRAWYPLPYNHFDPQRHRYYYGGKWGPAMMENITNASQPTVIAAQVAEASRLDITRGGFGSTSGYHGWVGG